MSLKFKSFPSFTVMIIIALCGYLITFMYSNYEALSDYSFILVIAGFIYAYSAYMMVINTRWLLRNMGKNPKPILVNASYCFVFLLLFLLSFEASENPESIVMRMPGSLIGSFILYNLSGFFICTILTFESGFRELWNEHKNSKTEYFRYKGPCPYCSSIVHFVRPVQACPHCKEFSIIQQNQKLLPVSEMSSEILNEGWMK